MSDITVNNFKAFYEQIRPYLGAVHSGFTPIGTVISVMGTTAPLNYLACDGTVYNISDYPELAAYFNEQFGGSNFFGGNGTTTFAVPDLRGEFLRGTGTNSHANQGSGANVGVHQDGTEHLQYWSSSSGGDIATYFTPSSTMGLQNPDSNLENQLGYNTITGSYVSHVVQSNSTPRLFTSRPTNTSVLYCIASKNIFMDAGSNYSTEEQVVGTWIDGKPIYQKTFIFSPELSVTPNAWATTSISKGDIEKIVNASGFRASGTNNIPYVSAGVGTTYIELTASYNCSISHLTVQYTKTTDA